MNEAWVGQLIPLVLIVAVFWLLILRPARKRQNAVAQLQRTLEPGVEVMLNSGIFGTVEAVDDEVIRLRVAPGSILRVHRQAVSKVVEPAASTSSEGDVDSPSASSSPDLT